MRIKIPPGFYLTGFPARDGTDYTHIVCRFCYGEWKHQTDLDLDLLLHEPITLQCPQCKKQTTYLPVHQDHCDATQEAERKRTIRQRRKENSTPLFGPLDAGERTPD